VSIAEYNPYQNRRQIEFHVSFNLLQPLSHISETTGNESLLKTTQMAGLDGRHTQVPIYSGNAQRNGKMGRRTGIGSFLDDLGVSVNKSTHQTLYSGGFIEGSTISDFDIESSIRQKLPQMSLLGGAIPPETLGVPKGKSMMMEGRLNIGDAYLVCFESLPYLYDQCPALVPWEAIDSISIVMKARKSFVDARYDRMVEKISQGAIEKAYEDLQVVESVHLPLIRHHVKPSASFWEFRESVRVPSLKQLDLHRHLAGGSAPLLKGEAKDDAKKPKKEAGRQMISGAWTIQRGAQLYAYWSSRGQGITELEEGALVNTLLEFSKEPYLGGKANSGCGLTGVSIRYKSGEESGEYLSFSGSAQALSSRAAECYERYQEMMVVYRSHIEEIKAGGTVGASDTLSLLGVEHAAA
jgi:hypothetical protein